MLPRATNAGSKPANATQSKLSKKRNCEDVILLVQTSDGTLLQHTLWSKKKQKRLKDIAYYKTTEMLS